MTVLYRGESERGERVCGEYRSNREGVTPSGGMGQGKGVEGVEMYSIISNRRVDQPGGGTYSTGSDK